MVKDKQFYTTKEAAEILGVPLRTVQYWLKHGRFPNAFKAFEGTRAPYLITHGDILQLKEELKKD